MPRPCTSAGQLSTNVRRWEGGSEARALRSRRCPTAEAEGAGRPAGCAASAQQAAAACPAKERGTSTGGTCRSSRAHRLRSETPDGRRLPRALRRRTGSSAPRTRPSRPSRARWRAPGAVPGSERARNAKVLEGNDGSNKLSARCGGAITRQEPAIVAAPGRKVRVGSRCQRARRSLNARERVAERRLNDREHRVRRCRRGRPLGLDVPSGAFDRHLPGGVSALDIRGLALHRPPLGQR